MPRIRKIVVAVAATVALAALADASPAAARYTTKVVPGQSIGGIQLGQTLASVHKFRPLNLGKPTSSDVQATALGRARYEIYTSSGPFPDSFVVAYTLPPKKKGKKKPPRVAFISTGLGFWYIDGGLQYNTHLGTASSPADAAKVFPCSFYQKTPSGQRLYNPDPGDGQYCELIYGQDVWFYLTFNVGGITPDIPAKLAGFSLSRYQLP